MAVAVAVAVVVPTMVGEAVVAGEEEQNLMMMMVGLSQSTMGQLRIRYQIKGTRANY